MCLAQDGMVRVPDLRAVRQIGGSLAFLELEELHLMRFFSTIAQADRRLTGRQLIGTIEPVFPGRECGNARLWRRDRR